MSSNKYLAIDKKILQEGNSYEFNIFMSAKSSKEMATLKEMGLTVSSADKTIVDRVCTLYVNESEYPVYEKFYKTFVPLKKDISFSEEFTKKYKNASIVLANLFNNPEALGNYEASKAVVEDMTGIISDNKFSIKYLMNITTHDYYTHTHSINVTIYALSLGSYLRLKKEVLNELGEAALLHDLGKSKIDPAIINKNAKLTDEEFAQMKQHPSLGYTIALKLGIKNRNVLEGIRHHHEKMDGSGYPFRMRGENIPLFARIVGMCDIFDALTSKRSYKEAMSTFEALSLMKKTMKEHIDSNLLLKMIEMFR